MELEQCDGRVWDFVRVLKIEIDKATAPILQATGLTEMQAFTIMALESGDPHSVGRFAEQLNANQGNFSAACKKMEQLGLVTRRRSQEDERVVTLELTELGSEKVKLIHEKLCQMFKKADLNQQQLDTIIAGYNEAVSLFRKINTKKENNHHA